MTTDSQLGFASYGKQAMRVVSWAEDPNTLAIRDLILAVEVEGQFDDSYLAGANVAILPSDTLRRHVLVECEADPAAAVEELLPRIGERILAANEAISVVTVHADEQLWLPIGTKSFVRGVGTATTKARVTADACVLEGGVESLELFSTSGSSFSGFLRDELTVQVDAVDRPMCGRLDARWQYLHRSPPTGTSTTIRNRLASGMADRSSTSVQDLLASTARFILDEVASVDHVRLTFTATSLHRLPQDLPMLKGTSTFEISTGPVGVTTVVLSRSR